MCANGADDTDGTDTATDDTTPDRTAPTGADADDTDDDAAYHDDDNDPFASNAAFIDLYSAPQGRAWADLTYDEAKDLATRARTSHEAPAVRDPLAEPTEDTDFVRDPIEMLDTDGVYMPAPVTRAHKV